MKKISVSVDKKGNKFFIVTFPYDPKIVESVKKIPLRKFDAKSKNWTVRADHQIVKYIEVFSKYFEFEINNDAHQLLEELKSPILEEEIDGLKLQLHPFQKYGVSKAIKFERCIIADEMGLGKSAQAIAAVEKTSAYPCLIVCPASLKLNWVNEINKWMDKKILVVSGGKALDDYDAEFVIINYDILEKQSTQLENIGFESIIFDESQYIKNHKTKRTKALKKLAKGIRYRFCLSGTPILSRPRELMPQLDALDRLDSFGGFWTFAKKYCGAIETEEFGWSFMGATNLDELYEKLNSICMIRRLKKDVMKELPPKQRTFVPIEIDNREEYEMAASNFRMWARQNLVNPEEFKKEINKSKKLTQSQKTMVLNSKITAKINKTLSAESLVKIEYLKQLCAAGKMTKLKEFIDNALDQDIKLVVFATHKDIQNKLWDEYKNKNACRIFAEDSLDERQKNIDKFQNDESCKIIITSLKAGGVGITLTASSTVLFVEFGWTPADHDQAEDRCHRIGQTDSVNCYYLYAENTIDKLILDIINKKRQIADAVMDGKKIDSIDNDIEELLKKFI